MGIQGSGSEIRKLDLEITTRTATLRYILLIPPHVAKKSISVSDLRPEHKSLSDEMRLAIITENVDTGCHFIFMTKFSL